MNTRARFARLTTAVVAVLGLLVGGLVAAAPAYAADSVTISPASRTVTSNSLATYTLTYSCSTTGNCLNSTITIPTNTVTGNGANTDFSSWVAAGTCPALTAAPGMVTFTLGTVLTGTYSCNFTVRAPNKTTLNGAQATITPTYTSSGGSVTAPTGSVLNVTAGRNVSMGSGVNPANVLSGAAMTLTFSIGCGSSQSSPNGDLGLTALSVTDQLPANFTFASVSTQPASLPGTLTTPAVGTSGGTITYVGNGSECVNPANNRVVFQVQGFASTNGVPDAVGSTICHTASSSFTYIDGFSATATPTPSSSCATVIDVDWRTGKAAAAKTMTNRGQYRALDNTIPNPYSFPGNWDGGSTTTYDITVNTNPGTTNSGLSYDIKDPLPCLDTVSGQRYLSNTPGVPCANPAYIPRTITVTGFTPPAGTTISLLLANGATTTVPYVTGTGWTLPTTPAVSEIDIPPFTQQGSNNFNVITFRVSGYLSPNAVPGHVLSNTTTVTAYLSGTSTQVKTTQGQTANILVADPALYGAGANVAATMSTSYLSNCVARVQLQGSVVEITQAPSQGIYLSYLAPAGVSSVTVPSLPFTMTGQNGQSYTVPGGVTPSNQVANYNGTGRTLIEWTIPAGLITTPGFYTASLGAFDINLGTGCAGTFRGSMTIGYGATIPFCAVGGSNAVPPVLPPSDPALDRNGAPTTGNFCGASAAVSVTAINPGFSVDKLVQGNLDATQIGAGGTGHVSSDGGAATYTVSFRNTGQSTLTNPVMYDLLPRIGDTRASSTQARNSQFAVALTGIGTLPAGLTVAYSQAVNPCRPEVLSTNPGCVDDWTTTPPSSLASVTALRFAYTGTVAVSAGFSAAYTVSTPVTATGTIAWNSVGTNVYAGDTLLGAAESSLTGLEAQSAQPAITKTASTPTFSSVGESITFTFTVTNNTAVALTNVGVTDALVNSAPSSVAPSATCTARTSPAATCSGSTTSLAPGQSATFVATYVTTQADLDHGGVSDQGTARATPPSGPALSNSSSVVTVEAVQAPALDLLKTASPTVVDSVGDVVEYSFLVTNSGNVTVSGVAIDETDFSGTGSISTITCPTGPLAPGASATCTATYSVTQEDLTAGVIDNSAVAMATAPGATIYSDESSASVDVDQTPSLSLVKSASPSEEASYNAGQVITYSFVVTNTGNIPVDDITINELDFTGTGTVSAIDCPVTTLAPAAQTTCTATYTLTQDDVDALILENTANATGTSVAGPVTSNDSSAATPQVPDASLALTKTASTAFVNGAGEVVTYTFAVRNNGNVTIHDIAIDETDFTGSGTAPVVTCPTTSLIPGGIVNCTGTYTVTQADMNAGSIENTAVATGLDPSDNDVESAASDWTITANVVATLSLSKTADVDSYAEVGATIEYSFEVTNTGNVTIEGVTIDESAFTGSGVLTAIDCPTGSVDPDDSVTCTAQYEVTQEDIDRGSIVNTATAGAYQLGDDELIESEESTVDIPAVIDPEVTLVKSATPTTVDEAGAVVAYEFLVTNTGNVTLTGVAITETVFTGTGGAPAVTCASTPLEPGADMTCTATYVVTQADVDAGALDNTAIATATAGAEEIESEESSASVAITRTASLSLVKSADPASPEVLFAGDTITYSFVVTNTGNVTITNPGISETEFTGTGTLPDPTCDDTVSLAPGDQFICQIVYTVTQEDVDAGTLSNTAQATGTPPAGTEPLAPPTDTVAIPSPAAPGLELVKETTTQKLSSVGQLVTYTFSVTNTGNTTVTGLEISEDEFTGQGDLGAVECPSTTVLPGQTIVCEVVYQVVAEDLDGTALENTATATGESAGGEAVVSDASSVVISDVVDARPPLAFTGATVLWGAGSVALAMLAAGGLLFFLVKRRSREQNAA